MRQIFAASAEKEMQKPVAMSQGNDMLHKKNTAFSNMLPRGTLRTYFTCLGNSMRTWVHQTNAFLVTRFIPCCHSGEVVSEAVGVLPVQAADVVQVVVGDENGVYAGELDAQCGHVTFQR